MGDAAVKIAVEHTLGIIERRARLYRLLVQATIAVGMVMIALAVFISSMVLLYAPAVGVALVSGWAALDSAKLNRWRRYMAEMGISPDVLIATLQTRGDVPQTTVVEMLRNLSLASHPSYRALLASCALTSALVCSARAIEARSVWWGITAFVGFLATLKFRNPHF